MTVKFEEPDPPRSMRSSKNDELIAACKANPGKWAVYAESAKSSHIGSTIGKGKWAGFTQSCRVNEDRSFRLYVRYMPDAAARGEA